MYKVPHVQQHQEQIMNTSTVLPLLFYRVLRGVINKWDLSIDSSLTTETHIPRT